MAIIKKQASYPSTSKEDIAVNYYVWKDDSVEPIGVLQLTHGWLEYVDRYDEMARYLANAGYVVCGQDHLGHGETAGLPYLGIFPGDAGKAMIEDMHELYKIVHAEYPDLPYFLYGHSMGSMMAKVYISTYGKDLAGAIICGTGYAPGWSYLLNPWMHLLYVLFGKSYKRTIKKADKKGRTPKVVDTISDKDWMMNSWLSFDEANIDNYIRDPYCGSATDLSCLNAFQVNTSGGKWGWTRKVPKDLPVFIISGMQDPVGLFGIAPELTLQFLRFTGHKNTKSKLYSHAKHEIHNESGKKDEVFSDILNFLDRNNPKR